MKLPKNVDVLHIKNIMSVIKPKEKRIIESIIKTIKQLGKLTIENIIEKRKGPKAK